MENVAKYPQYISSRIFVSEHAQKQDPKQCLFRAEYKRINVSIWAIVHPPLP